MLILTNPRGFPAGGDFFLRLWLAQTTQFLLTQEAQKFTVFFERSPDSYREHRFNGLSQIFLALMTTQDCEKFRCEKFRNI